MARRSLARPGGKQGAEEALRTLADQIRRVNPTGRALGPAMERKRYAEKARLQSEALERYPEAVSVSDDGTAPGIVLLSAPTWGLGLCHAVVAELSSRAREVVATRLASQESPRRALAPPSSLALREPSDEGGEGGEEVSLRRRFEALVSDFDYEAAKALLIDERGRTPAGAWSSLWLELTVDTLGDLDTARSYEVDEACLTGDDSLRALSRVHLANGDVPAALRCLKGRLKTSPQDLVEALVHAVLSSGGGRHVAAMETALVAELGAVPGAIHARLEADRRARADELRAALLARGNDPSCATCQELASALARLDPTAREATQLLQESHQRHLERHVRSALADVTELVRAGRYEAARKLVAETRPRVRRLGALRNELDELEASLDIAIDAAQTDGLRRDLLTMTKSASYMRFAAARAGQRLALLGELPRFGRLHDLLVDLAADDAVPLALALDELTDDEPPHAVVRALAPQRAKLAKVPAISLRFREALEEVVVAITQRTRDVETGAATSPSALREALAHLAREVARAPSGLPEVDAATDNARRALELGRECLPVLEAELPLAKLEAARDLTPRARSHLAPHIREAWRGDGRPPKAVGEVAFTHACGGVLGAFTDDRRLFLIGTSPRAELAALKLPAPMSLVRLETRGETVFAFGREGSVFAFRPRTLEPELFKSLAPRATDARMGAAGTVFLHDAEAGTLTQLTLSGQHVSTFPCQRMVWGDTTGAFCACETEDGAVIVLDATGRLVARHPVDDYRLLGLGEHPILGVPVFALSHKESSVTTLSYRAKSVFVTEWLDDAPKDVPVALYCASDATLFAVFEKGHDVEARRYAIVDFGLSEIARKSLGDALVLSTARGKLVAVRLDRMLLPDIESLGD